MTSDNGNRSRSKKARLGARPPNNSSAKPRRQRYRPSADSFDSAVAAASEGQQSLVPVSDPIPKELPLRQQVVEGEEKPTTRSGRMDAISSKLAVLDGRRQELAKKLDEAQKQSDYDTFQRIGNNYLGTILQSIDLYIELIREISSEPVSDELKNEFSEIVKKGSKSQGLRASPNGSQTTSRRSTRRSGRFA